MRRYSMDAETWAVVVAAKVQEWWLDLVGEAGGESKHPPFAPPRRKAAVATRAPAPAPRGVRHGSDSDEADAADEDTADADADAADGIDYDIHELDWYTHKMTPLQRLRTLWAMCELRVDLTDDIRDRIDAAASTGNRDKAKRCSLTVSKPVLTAPKVSALETMIS